MSHHIPPLIPQYALAALIAALVIAGVAATGVAVDDTGEAVAHTILNLTFIHRPQVVLIWIVKVKQGAGGGEVVILNNPANATKQILNFLSIDEIFHPCCLITVALAEIVQIFQ